MRFHCTQTIFPAFQFVVDRKHQIAMAKPTKFKNEYTNYQWSSKIHFHKQQFLVQVVSIANAIE